MGSTATPLLTPAPNPQPPTHHREHHEPHRPPLPLHRQRNVRRNHQRIRRQRQQRPRIRQRKQPVRHPTTLAPCPPHLQQRAGRTQHQEWQPNRRAQHAKDRRPRMVRHRGTELNIDPHRPDHDRKRPLHHKRRHSRPQQQQMHPHPSPPHHPVRVQIPQQQHRLKEHQARHPHRGRSTHHRQQSLRRHRPHQKQQKRQKKHYPAIHHARTSHNKCNQNSLTHQPEDERNHHFTPIGNNSNTNPAPASFPRASASPIHTLWRHNAVTPRTTALLAAALLLTSAITLPALAAPAPTVAPPVTVTVTDDGPTYTMSNGYLTVKVDKKTGDLTSVKTPHTVTPNIELMGFVSGHHAGYWEQSPALAARELASITIDPASDNGARGEVSVKGWSDGKTILGPNPTAAGQGGGLIADLEIRYTLERGAHGLYTYAIYTHQNTYPGGSVGESRFGFKLSAQVFDWLSIDDQRNALMPTGKDWDAGDDLNMKEARRLTTGVYKGRAKHKYDYPADQFKIPAFGWSSTSQKVGLYIINPSFEYLSSGPLHFELTGHLDRSEEHTSELQSLR